MRVSVAIVERHGPANGSLGDEGKETIASWDFDGGSSSHWQGGRCRSGRGPTASQSKGRHHKNPVPIFPSAGAPHGWLPPVMGAMGLIGSYGGQLRVPPRSGPGNNP